MFGMNQFNPYGYPMQSGPQSPFMPSPMSQSMGSAQSPQSGPDWLQVPTVNQVEQVQVQPGGKAWVMVQNEPVFALRVADQMGLVTTDYYRFEKIDPAVSAPAQDYVTRAEFEQFVASLQPAEPKKEASK